MDINAASDIVSEEQKGALTPRKRHRPRSKSSSSTISYTDEEGDGGKTKHRCSKSQSGSGSDRDSSPEPIKKPKFSLYQPTSKKDQNSWRLPSELAHYFNKHSRVFIDEADLQEQVKETLPVPSNIREVPKIDAFIQATWDSQGKTFMADKDKDLARIQNRIRDVMGPWANVWSSIESYRSGEIEDEHLDIDVVADSLQKSVLLLAQASNSVTYQRRMEALKSVKDNNKISASKMIQ